MQQVRKGRQWSTRASVPSFDSDSLQQLAFPDDGGANDGAPAKEDTSHVARRRLASEPAHELDVDEVELIDDALTAPIETHRARREAEKGDVAASGALEASASGALEASDSPDDAIDVAVSGETPEPEDAPRETSPEPTSLAPLAMDYSNAKAPFDLPLAPPGELRARPRFGMLIACSLVAAVVAGGLVVRRANTSASFDVSRAAAQTAPAPVAPREPQVEAVAAPKATPPVEPSPQAEVAAAKPLPPPPSTTGTIVGAADHRLWVDGALVTGFEATVHCGKHTVQVGSAGTPRAVDVPCGDSIKVAP